MLGMYTMHALTIQQEIQELNSMAAGVQQQIPVINTTVNNAYNNIVKMLDSTSNTIDQTIATITNIENNTLLPIHSMISTTLLPLLQNVLLIKAGIQLAGIGDISDVLQDVNELIQFIIQVLNTDIKPPLVSIQEGINPSSPLYPSLEKTKQSVNALLQ